MGVSVKYDDKSAFVNIQQKLRWTENGFADYIFLISESHENLQSMMNAADDWVNRWLINELQQNKINTI